MLVLCTSKRKKQKQVFDCVLVVKFLLMTALQSYYQVTLPYYCPEVSLGQGFETSLLDDLGISLPVFPSRTNLKLHKNSITPKMVKKVITNFDLLKESGLDCIPVVALKSCEPDLPYIQAEIFNICLQRVFQIVERSHRCSLYLIL